MATHRNEATALDVSGMEWGDAEMTKLAAALEYCHTRGALPALKKLIVDGGPLSTEHPALKAACEAGGIKLEGEEEEY